MKKLNNKGFSLVELIIVIAIMAVLIGILAPQYLKYVEKSRVQRAASNASTVVGAINALLIDAAANNDPISDRIYDAAGENSSLEVDLSSSDEIAQAIKAQAGQPNLEGTIYIATDSDGNPIFKYEMTDSGYTVYYNWQNSDVVTNAEEAEIDNGTIQGEYVVVKS